MDRYRRTRGTRRLWGLVLLALAYVSLVTYLPTLTGTTTLDGMIGVILGLYVGAHPAANAVDLLFLGRSGLREVSSEWFGIGWLALNLLVLALGWLVISIGATRFVG